MLIKNKNFGQKSNRGIKIIKIALHHGLLIWHNIWPLTHRRTIINFANIFMTIISDDFMTNVSKMFFGFHAAIIPCLTWFELDLLVDTKYGRFGIRPNFYLSIFVLSFSFSNFIMANIYSPPEKIRVRVRLLKTEAKGGWS